MHISDPFSWFEIVCVEEIEAASYAGGDKTQPLLNTRLL